MKHALIDATGAVANIILLDKGSDFRPAPGFRLECLSAAEGEMVSPGWRRDEAGGLVAPAQAASATAAAAVRKARLMEALDLAVRRDAWEAAIAAAKQTTRDYWACEPEIARSNPKMRRIAATCGLDWDGLVDRAAQI